MAALFDPYEYYGVNGPHGIIQWGHSDADDIFFWLADAGEDPDSWPVLVSDDLIEDEWYLQPMTASEFLYRMVTGSGVKPGDHASPMPAADLQA